MGDKDHKWEGKTSAELGKASAEQIWPMLEDFCNLHKWFPIDTCYQVDGVPGKPGLIRYCAFTRKADVEVPIMWAKEKLLVIDPIQRFVTYQVIDSNMGFKSYVATLKVLAINDDDYVEDNYKAAIGCKIEWSFVCDPIESWTFDDLFSFIQSGLQSMAEKMELECSAAT